MTAVSNIKIPVVTGPGIDSFHRERSKCVDSFALAEAAVVALLNRSDSKCNTEPFKQKIGMLRKIPAGPKYSKANKQEVDILASELEDLLAVRADIVHGPMQFAQIDGIGYACFVNAKDAGEAAPHARLLGYETLRATGRRVHEIAVKLSAVKLNPAS